MSLTIGPIVNHKDRLSRSGFFKTFIEDDSGGLVESILYPMSEGSNSFSEIIFKFLSMEKIGRSMRE